MNSPAEKEWFANNPCALRLKALTAEEFVAADLPERKLLIGPWLPVGGAAMIFGPAGVGKTQLALSIAMSIATGVSLLGWHVPAPREVLYLDGEMNPSDMQDRISARYDPQNSDPDGRLKIFSALMQPKDQEFINLAQQDHQAFFEPLVQDADVIIVDNLSALVAEADATENDAASWTSIHRWMMSLRARQKSVIFIHHSGKSGDQRGTSRRKDQLDTVIKLTDIVGDDGCHVKVEFVKHRGFYGRSAEPFIARMSTLPSRKITWVRSAADLAEEYRELREQGWTYQKIADRYGVDKSTVSRRLNT